MKTKQRDTTLEKEEKKKRSFKFKCNLKTTKETHATTSYIIVTHKLSIVISNHIQRDRCSEKKNGKKKNQNDQKEKNQPKCPR